VKRIQLVLIAFLLILCSSCVKEGNNPKVEVADTTEPSSAKLSWVVEAGSVTDALPDGIKDSSQGGGQTPTAQTPFDGDWVGVASFSDCQGQFAGNEGVYSEIIARFVTNESGAMKGFLAIPIQTNLNFKNVTVSYSADTETVLMEATFLNADSDGSAVVSIDEQGRAVFSARFDNGEGDALTVNAVLRQVGSEWSDTDEKRPSDETIANMKSPGIYTVAESYAADISLIPEWESDN